MAVGRTAVPVGSGRGDGHPSDGPRCPMPSVRDDDRMEQAVRIEVPDEIAAELLADGTAVRPLSTRGGGLGEVLRFVIDGVNTGSSVVTVATASVMLHKVGQRFAAHIRNSKTDGVTTVVVTGPRGERTLMVASDAAMEDVAEDFRSALESVGAGTTQPEG